MKIEFDNVKLSIPDSWKDIRLCEYEKWFMAKPKTRTEHVQYVADICKIEAKDLLNYPVHVFNIISNAIAFVFDADVKPSGKICINGTDYFISSADKLTLGEWADTEGLLTDDSDEKLSTLLAILCRPAGERYDADRIGERTELFRNLTCDKVLPLISFFLLKKRESDKILSHCLTVMDQANLLLRDTKTFVQSGDGIRRFRIWQAIKYIYLIRLLKKRLSKFSDFYYTELTNRGQRVSKLHSKNR